VYSIEILQPILVALFGEISIATCVCPAYLCRMNAPSFPMQRPQTPLERFITNPKLKFMEQCREVMRFKSDVLTASATYD